MIKPTTRQIVRAHEATAARVCGQDDLRTYQSKLTQQERVVLALNVDVTLDFRQKNFRVDALILGLPS